MSDQLAFDESDGDVFAHARRSDPETSHEAAASIASDKIRASQRAVLFALRRWGPMCDVGLVDWYQQHCERMYLPKQSDSGIRTRRSELVERGLVFDTGARVVLDSGRRAIVWQAVTA